MCVMYQQELDSFLSKPYEEAIILYLMFFFFIYLFFYQKS